MDTALPEPTPIPPFRDVYCNRTINLRSIQAIGYDMDYTLIHYHADVWERTAYAYLRDGLLGLGWPVEGLEFDFDLVTRGLVVDTQLGNIVKINRFGYIKRASHGTKLLDIQEQRDAYTRTLVDLGERRWVFMNTLFSLSEACMYAQLVDLRDAGKLPGDPSYHDIYGAVRATLDAAHVEGRLKHEITSNPEKFIDLDADTPVALLDQKHAGKKLLLITNSEWDYTWRIMSYAFDRFLPDGMTWKSLFDVIIVAARKPEFFQSRQPLFEVVQSSGLLQPLAGGLKPGAIHHGGHAGMVERFLKVSGSDILYVGDHIFGDVRVSKEELRWRTALVLHDLEDDLKAQADFQARQQELTAAMHRKSKLELVLSQTRLSLQRAKRGYGPQPDEDVASLEARLHALRAELVELDELLGPLAKAAWELGNARWGLLMRAGNDKSHLAHQIERRADIYTSRVSNFLYRTPFSYLRSQQNLLPHDLDGALVNPFQTDGPWSGSGGVGSGG